MTEPTSATGFTGVRGTALKVYIGLSGLLILAIWAAFIAAGAGVFELNGRNLAAKSFEDQSVLDAHRLIGSLVGLLVLLLLITVIVARPGRNLLIGTIVLFVLAIAQSVFAGIGEDHSWGGALHVFNAGVILVFTFWLHLTSRKVPRA
jgi:hypothetical protein